MKFKNKKIKALIFTVLMFFSDYIYIVSRIYFFGGKVVFNIFKYEYIKRFGDILLITIISVFAMCYLIFFIDDR